jgi:hypothetical protein
MTRLMSNDASQAAARRRIAREVPGAERTALVHSFDRTDDVVEDLLGRVSVDTVLRAYAVRDCGADSRHLKIRCPFCDAGGEDAGKASLLIDHREKTIFCEECQIYGTLLSLIHGFEHHQPPRTRCLSGAEFSDALSRLIEIERTGHRPA